MIFLSQKFIWAIGLLVGLICTSVIAEIPKPTLTERDAIGLIDSLANQAGGLGSDFLSQMSSPESATVSDPELETQWRGNKPEYSAAASVELWLAVPSKAKFGPLPLSQTRALLTFNSENVVVSDSTADLEAARTGIKIPVLNRPRLFDFHESIDSSLTVLVWPRLLDGNFQAVMVCPDRNIVRSQRTTRDGYAGSLGEQILVDSGISALSFSPHQSLFRVAQQALPTSVRRIVAARFGFRGEAAVEVLGAIKPAYAEVSVETSGQLTKSPALPDSVRAPNPKARLQYVSAPHESVLSDAADPLGAAVEFRIRSANPAGFERAVLARSGIAMRRIDLPRSVANAIGFGEAGDTADWDSGECALVVFVGSVQTNYTKQTWSAG